MKKLIFTPQIASLLLVVLFSMSTMLEAVAQAPMAGEVYLYGKVLHQGETIDEFKVVVTTTHRAPDTVLANGAFMLALPQGELCAVQICKEGFASQVLLMDTEVYDAAGNIEPFYMPVELVTDEHVAGVPEHYRGLPCGQISFDNNKSCFVMNVNDVANSRGRYVELQRRHHQWSTGSSMNWGLSAGID